jgi:hypothetical protein
MQIPDELIIFGRTYDVRNISAVRNLEGALGVSSYRERVIFLDPRVDMALALNTVWQEAVHIAQQQIAGTTNEAQARWIALFVHSFLASNPDILDCYRYGLEVSSFDEDDDDVDDDN